MRAILNKQSLEWLQDHRVFFNRKGGRRLRPGDTLDYLTTSQIEPYAGFLVGAAVCTFGTMSFSNSEVPIKLTVGRYCSLAHDIDAHMARHPIEHLSTSVFTHDPSNVLVQAFVKEHGGGAPPAFPYASRPAPIIEHDVWIGGHASLLPGVTVRSGAVVAANSVVTRDVGPYEIVGGNPARLIRKRFPDALIAGLLASEWWLYRFTDFADLSLDDPAGFLTAFDRRKPDLEPYRPPAARMSDMPFDN